MEHLSQYKSALLEAVKNLECRGRIQFYDRNLYTYLRIDDNFSYLATEVLAPFGFSLVPLMHKKFSPKTHISLMNNNEQDNLVYRAKVYNTYNKWRKTDDTFKIEDLEMSEQRDKTTGQMKIVCMLRVSSAMIEDIRKDLGMEATSTFYCSHIKLCENFL